MSDVDAIAWLQTGADEIGGTRNEQSSARKRSST